MVLCPGMICTILHFHKQKENMMAAGFLPMVIIHHGLPGSILQLSVLSEILEIPNSAGNHASPFITENSEYIVAATRFSVPLDDQNGDVPSIPINKTLKDP